MALDWCFVSRPDTRRFKKALGDRFGMRPDQVMIAASHTHSGPEVGTYLNAEAHAEAYVYRVVQALVTASEKAQQQLVPALAFSGMARTTIPMNRRRWVKGSVQNRPNPEGETYASLPICLVRDEQDHPIALLFSASTHPVCIQSDGISADYPGVATAALDHGLGTTCSMFLQGTGGDSRPGRLADGDRWVVNPGKQHTEAVGSQLAAEVITGLDRLQPVRPEIHSSLVETRWPLQAPPTSEMLQATSRGSHAMRARWACCLLEQLEHGPLADHAPITLQGISVGDNLRLVALAGEPMAAQGAAIETAFPACASNGVPDGATFALGYANGEGLYLATTPMLRDGGYESVSYWEFGFSAALAEGNEKVLEEGLKTLKQMGVH